MIVSHFAAACAVCFGDPASPVSRGLTTAVFFMMAVVAVVLSGIAWTGFVWTRRAKRLETKSDLGISQ